MNRTPERPKEILKTCEDSGKCPAVILRPAPLFRTVGLTAGLPPHRRLRSVLNTSFVDRADPVTERLHRSVDCSTFNGLKNKQDKPLPKIVHEGPQKDEVGTQTLGVQRWHPSGQLKLTARTLGRDTRVRTEREEYLFEEVWREQAPKVMRKKNKHVSDLSQWIQSLEITDSERKQNTKPLWNISSGRGKGVESLCEGAGQTRRDRRPHFLPPITQSDCLLNVPLLLPDNSPPPSPCSPSEILFFPLSVPHIQTRGDVSFV